jgi:hypothetical protein
LNILACCIRCGRGCAGGYPSAAWHYYKSTGIVTGGNYNSSQGCQPYTIPICDHTSDSLILSIFSENGTHSPVSNVFYLK